LGRESFVELIRREHVEKSSGDRNLPTYKALFRQRSMDQIIATVEQRFKDDDMTRKVAIHLCHRYSGERLRDIGERFGLGVTGISQASRRLVEQAEQDLVLEQQLDEVKRELGLCHV
jgi:REP-associated tyrosine transposase